jgi:hypothetical protein
MIVFFFMAFRSLKQFPGGRQERRSRRPETGAAGRVCMDVSEKSSQCCGIAVCDPLHSETAPENLPRAAR